MAGRTDGLTKNFRAGAAIGARLFIKPGASDIEALPAAAATDAIMGVSVELPAAQGERLDVAMGDIPDITYGGNVTRGDPLTSDAQGRAITAVKTANTLVRIGGFALVSAVAGDIGPMRFAPGLLPG